MFELLAIISKGGVVVPHTTLFGLADTRGEAAAKEPPKGGAALADGPTNTPSNAIRKPRLNREIFRWGGFLLVCAEPCNPA